MSQFDDRGETDRRISGCHRCGVEEELATGFILLDGADRVSLQVNVRTEKGELVGFRIESAHSFQRPESVNRFEAISSGDQIAQSRSGLFVASGNKEALGGESPELVIAAEGGKKRRAVCSCE